MNPLENVILMEEKIQKYGVGKDNREETNRTASQFLGNPYEYWSSADPSGKKARPHRCKIWP